MSSPSPLISEPAGSGRAAVQRDLGLPLGHDRGGEVQDQRRATILEGHADADRVGGHAPLDRGEGRHQRTAGHVDEVDRDAARRRRHLGPVADAAQVAGVAQGDDRHAVRLRPLDAEAHGLGPHRLAHPEAAVDEGEAAAVGDERQLLVGDLHAALQPLDVAQGPHHPVAVVADQVGAHQVATDAGRLGGRAAGGAEDLGEQLLERCRPDRDRRGAHGRTVRRRRARLP